MPSPHPDGDVQIVVIAKAPRAGHVKTRLTPPYTPEEAATLAEAALRDTLAAVAATGATSRTVALDGAVGDWLPSGFITMPQRGAGLDVRLAAAFTDAQLMASCPVLLVGMDTPQLTPQLLSDSCASLLSGDIDAVLGRATDGGWWALGLRRADPQLLLGVPMSTPDTGSAQLDRLVEHGLNVAMLPELTDVDDAGSARVVADAAPATRFAAALNSFRVST